MEKKVKAQIKKNKRFFQLNKAEKDMKGLPELKTGEDIDDLSKSVQKDLNTKDIDELNKGGEL